MTLPRLSLHWWRVWSWRIVRWWRGTSFFVGPVEVRVWRQR